MRYGKKIIYLTDERSCLLRSPEIEDAALRLDWLRRVSSETGFLARGVNELTQAVACMEDMIEDLALSPDALEIGAWTMGEMVGNVTLRPVSRAARRRHRAELGIAVLQSHWGIGLGTALMHAAMEEAWKLGFEQVELEVMSGNARAITWYQRLGFQKSGERVNAFKLPDGSYQNEICMYKMLV